MILFLLLLPLPAILALNYTEYQRQVLLLLPKEVRKPKLRTFGDEEMIAEEVTEMLGGSDSRWSYPTSSTKELSQLYEAEEFLVRSLLELKEEVRKAREDLSQPHYRQSSLRLASTDLPQEKHFLEAGGLGIVQVAALYQLNLSSVVEGELLTFPSPHSLSSSDCVQLARNSRDLGRLDMEMDWLKEAIRLQRNKATLRRLRLRLKEVRTFHDEVLLEHGYFIPRDKYEDQLGKVEQGMAVITKTEPEQARLREDSRMVEHLETMKRRDRAGDHHNTNSPQLHFLDGQINTVMYNLFHRESQNMSLLCSGEETRHPSQDRDLRCRMMTQGGDSYLRLGPFLLEELNTRPFIGLVHRFLGEGEAAQVRDRAGQSLVPTPYTVRGVWAFFSRGRASKIRYLVDRAGDVTADLTRRMNRLSPWKLLQPFAQENYQVMNYGPGGLISLHMDDATLGYQEEDFDSVQSGLHWRLGSTRLATAMIYLKSAVMGGRTVFPFLSLSVPASPLALLFWHNLTPDLTADTRAVHAACPVVVGDKWIMNKWITLSPHWDSHPCGRTKDTQGAFPRWRS